MPASGFLNHSGRNWQNPDCSFYLPVSMCRINTVHACAHRSSTTSQGCATVCYMRKFVCCYYSLIHPLCLSVCLYMYVRVSSCLYIQSWGAMHVQQAFDVRSNSWQTHSYVHTLSHIQHFQASTVLCQQPRETRTLTQVLKAWQKRRVAKTTTWCRLT